MKKTLKELAKKVNAELNGDGDCIITGIGPLEDASEGQLCVLNNPGYAKYLSKTKASAVIVNEAGAKLCSTNALIVKNPYLAYAKIAEEFMPPKTIVKGIHKTAVIGKDCQIDSSVSIGANVVIEDSVKIGENTCIEAGCVIGKGAIVGKNCYLHANATLYHDVRLGNRVTIHSNTVIGSDGFGFANDKGEWHAVPQLGTVVIEDDVSIGANTSIDRGSVRDTVIEKNAILDNQIQIAHNVRIGAHTAIAACVGIAGSTKIGKYCMIGGQAGFSGHLEIANHVVITGKAMITRSIKKAGIYSSGTGFMENKLWQRNAARFKQLDKMIKKLNPITQPEREKKTNE